MGSRVRFALLAALWTGCAPVEAMRAAPPVERSVAAPPVPAADEEPEPPRFVPTTIAGDGEAEVSASLLLPGDELMVVERGRTRLELYEVSTGRRRATSLADDRGGNGDRLAVAASGRHVVWRGRHWRLPSLEYEGDAAAITRPEPRPLHVDVDGAARLERFAKRHRFEPAVDVASQRWTIPRSWTTKAQIAPDGRHVWMDGPAGIELLQLPTGRTGTFAAWTTDARGVERSQPSVKPRFWFGPTLDRFVVTSLGASDERIGPHGVPMPPVDEAKLVDATTMRVIAKLRPTCLDSPPVWSPSGRWVLQNDCRVGATFAHDTRTGKVVRAEGSRGWSFADDDRTVVSGASLFDVETGARRFVLPSTRWPSQLHFTADGRALLAVHDGRITRWDLRDGSHRAIETRWGWTRELHTDAEVRHGWRPGALGDTDVVDLESLSLRRLPGEVRAMNAAGLALLQTPGAPLRVVDAAGAVVGRLGGSSRADRVAPSEVALSTDGAWAALGRDDGSVDIFDVRASRRVAVVARPTVDDRALDHPLPDSVVSLSFRPDGAQLAMVRGTASGFSQLAVVETKTGRVLHRRRAPRASLAWTRDGAFVLVGHGSLVAYRSDLSGFEEVVADKRRDLVDGALARLAAMYPNLARLQAAIADPRPDTAGFDDFVYDEHRTFGVRAGKWGAELLRVDDGARIRLDSGEILHAEGGFVIAPDGGFDVTTPALEGVLRWGDRPLSADDLAARRRPGLLPTFVKAALPTSGLGP